MLGFFPDPYPDELLYSVFARYSVRIQYFDQKDILQSLFNNRNAIAVVDLPSYLSALIANMPQGHCYTIDRLIYQHTLLPFYAPFYPSERIRMVEKIMSNNGKASASEKLGLMANSVPCVHTLKFCPLCLQNDKKQFGESYWHRLHQISGVEVCPEHQVFLEKSNVTIKYRKNRHKFCSTDDSLAIVSPRYLNLSKSSHYILFQIAKDSQRLLTYKIPSQGLSSFRERYLTLLINRQLANYNGTIKVKKLQDDFSAYYPTEILNQIHCKVDYSSQHNWLIRLMRSCKVAQHPLHHLLMIHFLGHNAESFFQLPVNVKLFGEGQWPCLNNICPQFRRHRIKEYNLSFSKDSGKPVASFRCGCCKFRYYRVGPDQSHHDLYRYSRVENYGELWESELTKLWSDNTISLREIARRLEVDPRTVKFHVTRLQLPMRNINQFAKKNDHQQVDEANNVIFDEQKELKRNEWLSLMQDHPEMSTSDLKKSSPTLYFWLYRNDKDWLSENTPTRKKPLPVSRVDWNERDRIFAEQVKVTVENLLTQEGKLVQITVAQIGRAINQLSVLQKHIDKLPLTSQVLSEVVETREEFAICRVKGAIEYFRQEGIFAQKWQIVRKAGLRKEIEMLPSIQQILDEYINSLDFT
ncbi:Tn7-like transposition protein D [Geminocystis sp. NIES-3708]|uniref:TnsD family Tn7-like transposition protein n=1 Tax=Geminocystis sp. NIES-3708 TaxID=1615909 RepID=UPI0005FCB7E3|nr:TnsD family Tn7-like transposition protein [Geminocystis sp. NIES-3708]BAQ60811.1 Tn7-like transposition protein D [Geminocystis sp. NIES-3708]